MACKVAFVALALGFASIVKASQPIVFCTTLVLATFDASDPSCDPKVTREYGTDILFNCNESVSAYTGATRYIYDCGDVTAQGLGVLKYVENPPKLPVQVCLFAYDIGGCLALRGLRGEVEIILCSVIY